MRYAWSYEDLYMLLSWGFNKNYLETNYPGITKFENITSYSSNNVENLTNDELKKNISDLNLL